MTPTRFAFIKARWHADIVDRALDGFCEIIPAASIDVFDAPGAFEMPLLARDLAASGRYLAVAAAAFVVDGGIYRHEFVAQAVVDGLMRAGLIPACRYSRSRSRRTTIRKPTTTAKSSARILSRKVARPRAPR